MAYFSHNLGIKAISPSEHGVIAYRWIQNDERRSKIHTNKKMRYDSFRNKREIGSNGLHKVTISAFAQPYSILNEPYHKTYHLGIYRCIPK